VGGILNFMARTRQCVSDALARLSAGNATTF
jgi:hypothetical protein